MKKCNSCLIEKSSDNFGSLKSSPDGYRPTCKECRKKSTKKYYDKNSQKIIQSVKEWVDKNKEQNNKNKREWARKKYWEDIEKSREYGREYKKNNPEKNTKSTLKYQRKRFNNDPIFKMKHTIRNRINRFHNSNKRTEEILGCSFDFFKSYIENKFINGMTWDNQGEWHYDHIKPISLAKTEEEVLVLNHYTNFQPLWAKDNLKKSNKYAKIKITKEPQTEGSSVETKE